MNESEEQAVLKLVHMLYAAESERVSLQESLDSIAKWVGSAERMKGSKGELDDIRERFAEIAKIIELLKR